MDTRFPPLGTAAVLLLATLSCGDDNTGEPTIEDDGARTLVDHALWQLIPSADDPFAAERTDESFCESAGYVPEDLGGASTLGIVTADCNFMSLAQPSLAAISTGDTVRMRMFHFELIAPEPADAHLAVLVGDEIVSEGTVPIPSDSGLVELTWAAADDAAEGTRIVFHLHNHGTNTWNLIDIAILPE